MDTIKPITTHYNGYAFRSRLEARWAVFFDALGVKWEYEKEGFNLGSLGWYLPDFWLPDLGYWIEIKPDDGQPNSGYQVYALPTGKPFIVRGAPGWDKDAWGDIEFTYEAFPGGLLDDGRPEQLDACYLWCECEECGAVGLEFDGRSDRLPCKGVTCKRSSHGDKGYTDTSHRILLALDAARSARFEHGAR